MRTQILCLSLMLSIGTTVSGTSASANPLKAIGNRLKSEKDQIGSFRGRLSALTVFNNYVKADPRRKRIAKNEGYSTRKLSSPYKAPIALAAAAVAIPKAIDITKDLAQGSVPTIPLSEHIPDMVSNPSAAGGVIFTAGVIATSGLYYAVKFGVKKVALENEKSRRRVFRQMMIENLLPDDSMIAQMLPGFTKDSVQWLVEQGLDYINTPPDGVSADEAKKLRIPKALLNDPRFNALEMTTAQKKTLNEIAPSIVL